MEFQRLPINLAEFPMSDLIMMLTKVKQTMQVCEEQTAAVNLFSHSHISVNDSPAYRKLQAFKTELQAEIDRRERAGMIMKALILSLKHLWVGHCSCKCASCKKQEHCQGELCLCEEI